MKKRKLTVLSQQVRVLFLGTNKGILRVREDFLSNIRTNFQIDLNVINDIKFDGKFYWIATNKALWKLDKLINPTLLKRVGLGNYTSILFNKKSCIELLLIMMELN